MLKTEFKEKELIKALMNHLFRNLANISHLKYFIKVLVHAKQVELTSYPFSLLTIT